MIKKSIVKFVLIGAFVASGFFAGCSKDDADSSGQTGKIKIQLTDAPFPSDLVEEANVTISKIEVRKSSEHTGSPFVTLSEEEMSFNLLELTNGITDSLINMEIDTGSYDLMRLYVSDASIKLSDGTVFDLKVPSGAQSGIKVFFNPEITVAGGLTTELLLDFDVSKSFVAKGSLDSADGIKGFNFSPVIKAANMSTAGRLTGVVADTDTLAVSGAQVSILASDTTYTTSFTDENGEYAVLGIDAGTYDVIFAKDGYQSDTTHNVQIVAANATTLNVLLSED